MEKGELTYQEALDLVSQGLQKYSAQSGCPMALNEGETIVKPYGWVFFYNSKQFLESGEFRHALAGNGPVIVNKYTGEIVFCGSVGGVEGNIQAYESQRL